MTDLATEELREALVSRCMFLRQEIARRDQIIMDMREQITKLIAEKTDDNVPERLPDDPDGTGVEPRRA